MDRVTQFIRRRRQENFSRRMERIRTYEQQLGSLIAQGLTGEITQDEYFKRRGELDTPVIDLRKAATQLRTSK